MLNFQKFNKKYKSKNNIKKLNNNKNNNLTKKKYIHQKIKIIFPMFQALK